MRMHVSTPSNCSKTWEYSGREGHARGTRGGRIADLPLAERRRLKLEKQRELEDGFTRRHLSIATYRQRATSPRSLLVC